MEKLEGCLDLLFRYPCKIKEVAGFTRVFLSVDFLGSLGVQGPRLFYTQEHGDFHVFGRNVSFFRGCGLGILRLQA